MAQTQFDLCQFTYNPTHDRLLNLKKDDWKKIAIHYNITFTSHMTKEVLKNVAIEELVNMDILPEVALETLTPIGFPNLPREEAIRSKVQTRSSRTAMVNDSWELGRLKLEYKFKMTELDREKEERIRIAEIEKEVKLKELEVREIEAKGNHDI